MANARFHFPTQVHTGKDAMKAVPDITTRFGNKALLVTSRRQFQDSDLVERLHQNLLTKNINTLVYDDTGVDGESGEVDQIALLAKSARCDVVIGLGGDTVLNVAKAVALLCTNPGEATDYLTEQDGYRLQISREPLPTILCPTAFGTLGEVTPGFVLKDAGDGFRKKLYNTKVTPTCAVMDPALTKGLSRKYVAASALLVLAYAVELYTSSEANAISDCFSEKAIELVHGVLPVIQKDPDNVEARGQLQTASLVLAYGAAAAPLGPIYALCEAITSKMSTYKGSLATVLLPQLMEYNLTSSPARYVQVVKFLGEDVSQISVLEAAIKAVERVRLSIEAFNIPTRLGDLGFTRDMIPDVTQIFSRFEESKNNARPIAAEDLRIILEQSL